MPANTADFFGEGVNTGPAAPHDPDDDPNPANPGGISNNQLRAQQAAQLRAGHQPLNPTVSARAVNANPAATSALRGNIQHAPVDNSLSGIAGRGLKTAGSIVNSTVGQIPGAAAALNMTAGGLYAGGALLAKGANVIGNKMAPDPAQAAAGGSAGPTRPTFAEPVAGAPGAPPAGGPGTPGAPPAGGAAPGTPGWAPVSADVSSYDTGTQAILQARDVFQRELDRLSGVDPFGNQAFLQKATDRAVAQAAGTAAGARGGAAALAGANRQAVGVQAQTAARGTQEMTQQRATDANAASQQRLAAAGGIMSGATAIADNEGKKADAYLKASAQNLQAYLGGRELDQRETESLRNVAVELAKVDQQRYATDVGYRESVNQQLTEIYKADTALQGLKYSTDAGENLSEDEWLMGLMGAGSGIAQGAIAASDRRAKFDIHDPDMRDLQDYLGNTRGKLYRYKEPHKPGRRAGLNFGPMAQDLAKSKIGRTLVVDDGSGTLKVDTGRLALADHAALAALAAEVAQLRKGSRK